MRLWCSFTLALAIGVTGCHRQAPRVSQSGDWSRISCPHLDKRCFNTARALCPNGYVFSKEVGSSKQVSPKSSSASGSVQSVQTLPPQEEWHSGMYTKKPGTLMVRCSAEGDAT